MRCIALYSQRWLALRGVLALHCVIVSAFAGHCLGFSSLASVAFLAFYSQPGCGLLGVVLSVLSKRCVVVLALLSCVVVSPRPLHPHYTPIGRVSGQQLLLGTS